MGSVVWAGVVGPLAVFEAEFLASLRAAGYALSTPVWSWTFPPVSCLTLLVGLHVRTSEFFALGSCALEAG